MPKTAATVPNPNEQILIDHLKRCRREGQSLAGYGRTNHLKIWQFYAWKTRLEARGLWSEREQAVSFLPVKVYRQGQRHRTVSVSQRGVHPTPAGEDRGRC